MNKALKVGLLTLGSLLAVLVLAIVVVCCVVLAPARLTPIVQEQLNHYMPCSVGVERVELTVFSTYPDVCLQLTDVCVADVPMTDTLACVGTVMARIDVGAFLWDNEVVVSGVQLKDGYVDVYVDSLGNANYGVFLSEDVEEEQEDSVAALPFAKVDIQGVELENIAVRYVDKEGKICAEVDGLNCTLGATMMGDDVSLATKCSVGAVSVSMNDTLLLDEVAVALMLDADVAMGKEDMRVDVHESTWSVNDLSIAANGSVMQGEDDMWLDVAVKTNVWDMADVLALVPDVYADLLSDVKQLEGNVTLGADVKGAYGDSIYPTVAATIGLVDGAVSYTELPTDLRDMNGTVEAFVDMNQGGESSYAVIKDFKASTGSSSLDVSGRVDDLMGDMYCDLTLGGSLHLPDVRPYIPDDLDVKVNGNMDADVSMRFLLSDVTNGAVDKVKASGAIAYRGLDVAYGDSMSMVSKDGKLQFARPSTRAKQLPNEFMEMTLASSDIKVRMVGTADAHLVAPKVMVALSNPLDTTRTPAIECNYSFHSIDALMDSMSVAALNIEGGVKVFADAARPKVPRIQVAYGSEQIAVEVVDELEMHTSKIRMEAFAAYDASCENMIDKWSPNVNVDFNSGVLKLADVWTPIEIPAIRFDLTPEEMDIADSRIVIAESDFGLNGKITNLRGYIAEDELLEGELNYSSENTNVDQLMALMDGYGSEDEQIQVEEEEVDEASATADTTSTEASPFMVPKGIDVTLNTHINKAVFNETDIENIKGRLTVNDGKLVLEQMGFTSQAAEMLLTAVYRSDRTNHLFAGFDFHLLNIDIAHLIDIIPEVDSIIPMLASFEGKGAFHCAGETYLFSDYSPKMSTLRAAAAIEGKDLVLLDGETFADISKMLMFKNKTRNLVDSLSVEATIFRNEVDIYPFLVSMDRWQAVLAGRHNLDMSFNYHISLTDCPLPMRLGLDVKGTLDDLKYDLVKCKYKSLYKPKKQNAMDERILGMKKIVSNSLKNNAKELKETSEDFK